MTNSPPLHQAQITRNLPEWSKTLYPAHTKRIMQRVRKDYLDENGAPYSWYAAASPEARHRLQTLINERDTCQVQLKKALAGLKGISEFCKPLLASRLRLNVAVDKAQYVFQPFTYTPRIEPDTPEPAIPLAGAPEQDPFIISPVGAPQTRSLLEAAMHNFEGLAEVGPYSQLTVAPGDDNPLPGLSLADFVRHCRDLDLGQRYQDHLETLYEGPNKGLIERLTSEVNRKALRAHAQVAAMQGLLTAAGLQALTQLGEGTPKPLYGNERLYQWRFTLFDIPIHETLLIGPDETGQTNPCIVYMPNDPETPLREFTSRQAAGVHLRGMLLAMDFRRTLIECAPLEQQRVLAVKLENALFVTTDGVRKPNPTPKLHFTPLPLREELWKAMYSAHLSRLKADARTIAVPTADVDAKARHERLSHWLDVGLNVLNVAAFFVPGLNAVMMSVFAYQIMDNVFTGYEAWEEGDTAQALAQLQSLAINAAVIAGFAVGTEVIKASGFVDTLTRVLQDDRELLWHADMQPYASSVELPQHGQADALGHHVIDGKRYLGIEGNVYEVFEHTDKQWYVRHPEDPQAYTPRLIHDGDQRWRLATEQPLQWDDAQLMHRLGTLSEGLSPSELGMLMRITDTDPAVLRRAHALGLRPPALLSDAMRTLQSHSEADLIIQHVRDALPLAAYKNYALPELLNLPGWPESHVLKVFDGPEPWGSATHYGPPQTLGQIEIEITRSDLETGKLGEVVVAQLDSLDLERLLGDVPTTQHSTALNKVLADRLTQQRSALIDSLQQGHRQPPTAAAQTLGRQFPGLPQTALEEILGEASSEEHQSLENGRTPLRIAEEARLLQTRSRLDRAILGLYRPGLSNDDSERLAEALKLKQPRADGAKLLQYALEHRQECATLIGQQPIRPGFRSPLRLDSGRLGYPLSGRGAIGAKARLKALYPALANTQLDALYNELSAAGDLGSAINQRENEYRALETGLDEWFNAAPDGERERLSRHHFRRLLKNAWRREPADAPEKLTLDFMTLPTLPSLNVRLPHIRTLEIKGLQLQRLDGSFLQYFPNLRELAVNGNPEIDADALFQALNSAPGLVDLHLVNNGLTELTRAAEQSLQAMPGLRLLNLGRNNLQLSPANLTFLARIRLEALNLAHNQITLDEALASQFQSIVNLQLLYLDFNPLRVAPDFSFMARLRSLRLNNCELTEWPRGLTNLMNQANYQLRRLNLSHNRIHTLINLDRVLNTPFARAIARRAGDHDWSFNYNALLPETWAELNRIHVNVHELVPDMPQWQRFWRGAANTQQENRWAALFEQEQNADLLAVLERLTQSAEARSDAQGLRKRVWELLRKAAADTALRERLGEVAQAFPPTCGDAGADGFSALEIEVLAYDAAGQTGDHAQALTTLYRKLYRRDIVNVLADRISNRRRMRKDALLQGAFEEELPAYDALDEPEAFSDHELRTELVDDIEVRLALRQALSTTLDFPEPSHGMLYRATANITPTIIENVRVATLAREGDATARQQWMRKQPAWAHYIRRHYHDQFTAVVDFWRQGMDYLYYCLSETNDAVERLDGSVTQALAAAMPENPLDEHGTLRRVALNEWQFRQAADALLDAQKTVEDGLLLSLTRNLEGRS
ncbi:NEL-type E3 ubiquitin ligase domain-containing protein [Pseudomonas sp. NPDC090233]|uniref:NEL-type E3 ubiquitin ligase domain-containing protein n=1 Tax=Pseudomonas sp. NPDC090233 TaxID=3364479 RepID=UPI00383B292B